MPLQNAVFNAKTKEVKMVDITQAEIDERTARQATRQVEYPAELAKVKLIRLLDQQQKWANVKSALVGVGTAMDEFNAMITLPFDDPVTDIIINGLGYNLEQKKALFRQLR